MTYLAGAWRGLVLSIAANIASVAMLETLARAEGLQAQDLMSLGRSIVALSFASSVPAGTLGLLATQLPGSYLRRLARLSALAFCLYLLGFVCFASLLALAPGDDPYALPAAPHFWEIFIASIAVPAVAGVALLVRWIEPERSISPKT